MGKFVILVEIQTISQFFAGRYMSLLGTRRIKAISICRHFFHVGTMSLEESHSQSIIADNSTNEISEKEKIRKLEAQVRIDMFDNQ